VLSDLIESMTAKILKTQHESRVTTSGISSQDTRRVGTTARVDIMSKIAPTWFQTKGVKGVSKQ
jgi:hypothetical protein